MISAAVPGSSHTNDVTLVGIWKRSKKHSFDDRKVAMVVPMPSASVRTTASVTAGCFLRARIA